MSGEVLVVNAGSSTLKLAVVDARDDVVAEVLVEAWESTDADPLRDILEEAPPISAVGHRVVHGGPDLTDATLVDDDVVARIDELTPLAPLHQPRAVAGLRTARQVLPGVAHVACFDTSHHATLGPEVSTYAVPEEWRDRWPTRRFGFHGLSHAHAARRADEMTGPRAADRQLRVVSCHLGSGASLGATRGGRSVDTTMGFTPLEGLVMQTRSGSLDPGLVLWLITEQGLGAAEVADALEHRSGMAALAGGSGDMREVLERRSAGDERARTAVEVYTHRVAREVAAMTVALGGLDALVFTAGVGERAAAIRAETAQRLHHLGVAVDDDANQAASGGGDHDVSAPGAGVRALVVESREDLEISRRTRQLTASEAHR